MSGKKRVELEGGDSLGQNPFEALTGEGLPPGEASPATPEPSAKSKRGKGSTGKKRGRVEIRREKSGRGGKTVTTATGFQAVCPAELEEWTAHLKKRCGTGGTAKPGTIEIQGDRREDLVQFFEEKGFRPVRAGG